MWTRLDLGAILAAVDRTRAADVLRTVGTAAERGGDHRRPAADQQLRALGVRTWRRAAATAGVGRLASLTDREREDRPARRRRGRAIRQIAAAVFLSWKTVERHLSNIFAKAGVRNRAELAALAADETAPPHSLARNRAHHRTVTAVE